MTTTYKNLHEALAREIAEETGGCAITQNGQFSQPLEYMSPDPEKPSDLAFWRPVVLRGEPKPSDEALDHPWLSRHDLESGQKYRPVSGLGLKGRTGRMMMAALDFYESNKNKPELFS